MAWTGASWASKLKANAPPVEKAGGDNLEAEQKEVVEGRKVVLDSGAIIKGGRLERLGDKFWTIQEVLSEVRDSNARMVLETFPFELQVISVDPEALAFVSNFSKLTGDYQRLSVVDLKVMALTYQLEKRFNGTDHLNAKPQPPKVPQPKPSQGEGEGGGEEGTPEGAAAANEGEEGGAEGEGDEGDEEEIDPSEFERVPLA
eukprot:CAMPEP_0181316598 /NCGR_PEP_ID=MMETSP1101-20121128/15982_1 /TAXON_ID=46948 /ORGANISM="Rhodomonas abbreviata, Strain Caron Lab Isolate" /LENGTH=201 /DNA_ID=CAMNT_0023423859 /DNA_START=70 /DNA_END=671 /DNA_ORIENTATION=+